MKEIILLKNGEMALKGLNRGSFEDVLIRNLKRRLKSIGEFRFSRAQSTVMIEGADEGADLREAAAQIGKVFGVAAYSVAGVCEKDLAVIKETAARYLEKELLAAKTFRVSAKRSDKRFPYTSPQICEEVGGYLLDRYPHLSVDLHTPDLNVMVEVRDFGAYIHGPQQAGPGGLPVGTSGRALLLLSGGIDSPVAGYMMAKRGLSLNALHFASPPYTGERAKQKVIDLAQILAQYCGHITLNVVHFTEIQEAIGDHCPEELYTIIMRRFMMRIACRLAESIECGGLVTGESLAQVASQTLGALRCTEAVCTLPVLRPLIGMDKEEIIRISRQIGAFETSTLPYEDCCTVFTPRHPRTRPELARVEAAEANLDVEGLTARALERIERIRNTL